MNALHYARELIAFDSVSSKSNLEISDYVQETLEQLDFRTERIEYERDGVMKANVIGCRDANSTTGGLAFFGHTDVVPAEDWSIHEHGPFEPVVRGDRLYGRGSTDMKGPIACMLAAAKSLKDCTLNHPLYVCCTADEELDHRGVKEVISRSKIYRALVAGRAHGIVGEPTEMNVVHAHKGGAQLVITAHGRAAHSSTRDGINANLAMIPFLGETKRIYDETESDRRWMNDEYDPPTICLNIGVNDHNTALNVTAATSICTLCFRPMPSTNVDELIHRMGSAAETHGLDFQIRAQNPPFHRDPQSEYVRESVQRVGGTRPITVAFGTEAGNLSLVEKLIVLGPGSISQAHKCDEWISLEQLATGEARYRDFVQRYCLK